jgi:hypothetical protein
MPTQAELPRRNMKSKDILVATTICSFTSLPAMKQNPHPGTTILAFYYEPNTANLKFDGIDKVADHIVKVNNRSATLLVRLIPDVEGMKFPRNEIREFVRMIKQEND